MIVLLFSNGLVCHASQAQSGLVVKKDARHHSLSLPKVVDNVPREQAI